MDIDSSSPPSHGIVCGIFGVYCSQCNRTVKKTGNSLYPPDRKTIGRHFADYGCYIGDTPNTCAVERELIRSQEAIQESAKVDHRIAREKINEIFPNGSTTVSKAHVCQRCGHSSTRMDTFKKHFLSKSNQYGCQQLTDASDGKIDVCTGVCGIICPKHFLEDAEKGIIHSPNKRSRPSATPISMPPNINASQHFQKEQQQQLPMSNGSSFTQQPFQPIVTTPSTVLDRAIEGSPQKRLNDEARVDDALSCFIDPLSTNRGDKSNKEYVKKHRILVAKAIDEINSSVTSSEQFFRQLVSKTSTLHSPEDHAALKAIHLAGTSWLTSNSANNDVSRISQGHRGRLFQVSEPEAPDAEMLVRGKTFVPSASVDKIVTVWNRFIHFITRYNPKLIEAQLTEAQRIYFAKLEHHDKEMDALKDAAAEIVETNIIFGIVLAAVHETPQKANGMNSVEYFLVASAINAPVGNRLSFKYGGSIGEYFSSLSLFPHSSLTHSHCLLFATASDSNNLLRLIRHCVCSHLVRMAEEKTSQDDYMNYATSLLNGMQNLPSIQSICGVIRMGKEVAKSKPVSMDKAFDEDTGAVMYNQVIIEKEVWSTAIPRTAERFVELLETVFDCHSLLKDVLNPNNKLVLAGADTTVTIVDESGREERVINVVQDIIPNLGGKHIQATINELFSLEQGTLLYLSSGAGRGEEVKGVHPFETDFQLIFNHLHFQMRSSKAINHGVNPNGWVDHFVSPSLSRLIVVLNLCVYTAARQLPNLQLPIQDDAKMAAGDMFRSIFGVSTNTKDYREFCIQIMNYLAPVSLAKTSTPAEFARQFHHSSSMHNDAYSSSRFHRRTDGRIERSPIFVARKYHAGLGEQPWNDDRVADIEEDQIPQDMYHKALQRALGNSSVRCNTHQLEGCRFLDDHSNNKHVMVFRPPGTGKSFLWNGILLARYLRGSKWKKFIVLSPHSSLLAQHVLQSRHYFRGTSLHVASIHATELDTASIVDDFDLCYISIHTFAVMVETKKEMLNSWGIGTIYIDECHLLFCELFRIGTSWTSIQDIQCFGTKLVCLSATMNPTTMTMIANYMGIKENYTVIGDAASYTLPNVAITVKKVKEDNLITRVVGEVQKRFGSGRQRTDFALHVMTMTKRQATAIANMIASPQIKCTWLTSEDTQSTRTQKMQQWADGNLDVLVSTMNCGFDCGTCKEAFIVGGIRSVADAVQSIGRIRPQQQNKSPVTFWLTERSWDRWDLTRMAQSLLWGAKFFDC